MSESVRIASSTQVYSAVQSGMELKRHGIGHPKRYITMHPNVERNLIATQIIEALMINEDIDTIFLSGSTTHGGTDNFSDIDINVVVDNPEVFRKEILLLISSIGEVIHSFTPHNLSNILVIYLSDLTKIDFGIYTSLDIQTKQCILKGNEVVLKGRIDLKVKANSQNLDCRHAGETYLAMALADLIAIPREIYRNNIYEARANLDDARRHIAIYINLTNNDIYHDYNNFCQFLKKKQIHMFRKSLNNNDEYLGILESALLLLEVIKGLKIFKNKLIETVEQHLIKNKSKVHPKQFFPLESHQKLS